MARPRAADRAHVYRERPHPWVQPRVATLGRMKNRRPLRPLFALGCLMLSCAAMAAPPQPFSATYQVLQDGELLGEATVRLQPAGGGDWTYSKQMEGTAGLAALLGANLRESSRFAWKGDVPEAISYDYELDSALKKKQRHLRVDWPNQRVSVDEGKGAHRYAAVAGMVERNTTALAIGMALRDGRQQIALPVAVRQRVETQRFAVNGKETVKVPAGSFHAVRVDRTDTSKDFSAWYAPDRYLLPVRLSQREGGNLTMQLVSFTKGPKAAPAP